jgi:GTP-binding protein
MPVPTVAIIGRANVGKSTLFNKLTRKKSSIVNNTPGVTRDRLYALTDWLGKPTMIIDTGGIDLAGENEIEIRVKEQSEFARSEADVIIFVVDKQVGMIAEDREIIDHLRRSGKPLFLAVNKVDHSSHEDDVVDFMKLGMDRLFAISAEHGNGVYELMEAVSAELPENDEPEEADDVIRIAFIGKPNVGKSSLVNRLLQTDRCIVSDIPGTTRDAVDTKLEYNGQKFILVDTAGLRRKGKTKLVLDKFSAIMALKAMDRCDIAILVIDAATAVSDQDAAIAGYAVDRGRGCVILGNKWDLAKKQGKSFTEFTDQVKHKLKFLDFAPIMPVSALSGEGMQKLLPEVEKANEEYTKKITTGRLNDCIEHAIEKNPLSSYRGKFLKYFYATQVKSRPPTFRLFVNYPEGIHFSYQRYLMNSLRKHFGFTGTPVRLFFSGRKERK